MVATQELEMSGPIEPDEEMDLEPFLEPRIMRRTDNRQTAKVNSGNPGILGQQNQRRDGCGTFVEPLALGWSTVTRRRSEGRYGSLVLEGNDNG